MNSKPADTRDLLVKLCGMLGSEFDGERAAAALKLTGLLKQVELTWDEVLTVPGGPPEAAAPGRVHRWSQGCRNVDWRADLACCDRHRSLLTDAEAKYVDDLRTLVRSGRMTIRGGDVAKLAALARRVRGQLSARAATSTGRCKAHA